MCVIVIVLNTNHQFEVMVNSDGDWNPNSDAIENSLVLQCQDLHAAGNAKQ